MFLDKGSHVSSNSFDIDILLYLTSAKFKKEFKWLKDVDNLALVNAQLNLNLDTAYEAFL